VTGPARRADAQRSYDRILEAAEAVISRDGAHASLEEIARSAGVGSATLHRHFASRAELLDAVFTDRVDALCAEAQELAITKPAGDALAQWLRALMTESARNHGLAKSMFPGHAGELLPDNSCHQKIQATGLLLLSNAVAAGAVRSEVSFTALFNLISAIVLFSDGKDGSERENQSMIDLVLDGVLGQPATPGNE
jgi:AcrR family transcriptional regulator